MVIYLYHEKHGAKVACSEGEAVFDESHGWKRGISPEASVENTPARDLERLRDKWQAKFGKKPHHMKKPETLQAELDA